MLEAVQATDAAIVLFFQNSVRSEVLNVIMEFITRLGDSGAIWLLSGMLLFVSRKYRKAGFDVIVTVAICWGVNQIFKEIVMRPRPYTDIAELTALIAQPASWSFPSGHACTAFAAAYAYTRGVKHGAWAYVPAVLIAVSRVYIGVHYPSDIVVGAAVGTVFAVIVYALSKRFIKIPEYTPPEETDEETDEETGEDNGGTEK